MSTKDDALIETIARAMCAEMQPNKDPDELGPAPRGTFGLQPFWYRGYGRQARAALAVARKAILEEALREILSASEGKTNDVAYGMHEAGRVVVSLATAIVSLATQEQHNG